MKASALPQFTDAHSKNHGETGTADESAQAEAKVHQEIFQPGEPAGFAHADFIVFGAAKLDVRAAASFFGG